MVSFLKKKNAKKKKKSLIFLENAIKTAHEWCRMRFL